MSKLKHEKELVKKAIEVGERYAVNRGYKAYSATMSQNEKIEGLYRLLVHDKLIPPMPVDQESILAMKHRLAVWISKKLPQGDPLLK